MHIVKLLNTNISVELSINHLLSKSNVKMYNKKSYVKACCEWIQCIEIIKMSKENLKSNYQTHSSVAPYEYEQVIKDLAKKTILSS